MTSKQLPPELASIVKASDKRHNRTYDPENENREYVGISTGSSQLDKALGIGGLPAHSITEIFGWQSTGKTSLALSTIANAQRKRKQAGISDMFDLIIDMEHSMPRSLIEGIGADLDQIIWRRPLTAEHAFDMAENYPKSGNIDTVLFDSIDAVTTEKQLQLQPGEEDNYGGAAKPINRFIRKVHKYASEYKTTYLFINQLRDTMSLYSGPRTSGGNALKFYSAVRLRMFGQKPSDSLENALRMRLYIDKNKTAPPYPDEIAFDFIYGKGVDPRGDLYRWAKDNKVVYFGGTHVRVLDEEEREYETVCSGGKAGLMEWLEDEDNFNRVKELCEKVSNREIQIPT